ncbi:hypothetical protein K1719_032515 [Acacia pycnantha]|nr:hypothetical protein K1719_044439 [Acacia pycnantha]KAI9085672.1 hypothetical protein K1719_032515 [Acacia pycnantha]
MVATVKKGRNDRGNTSCLFKHSSSASLVFSLSFLVLFWVLVLIYYIYSALDLVYLMLFMAISSFILDWIGSGRNPDRKESQLMC